MEPKKYWNLSSQGKQKNSELITAYAIFYFIPRFLISRHGLFLLIFSRGDVIERVGLRVYQIFKKKLFHGIFIEYH